jgi:transcriptional regulator with XRE-family HTH domain|tara:strand:+ start:3978 stop:4226 length:249 start_codon:yes stop_codon:yes gene_type:complete
MPKDLYRDSVELKNDLIDFGDLLRDLRESKGMTMRELEIESGVMAYHICNMENKNITTTFVTMSKLFNALGYSILDAYQARR